MEINIINEEAIIFLILKIFMKIVTMVMIFMKKSVKYNDGNSLNE